MLPQVAVMRGLLPGQPPPVLLLTSGKLGTLIKTINPNSFSIVVLLFSSSFTQAAPANSDLSSDLSSKLSSDLSSRTEVAEWHSNYNTSDLAFPETGTCYPQPSPRRVILL